MRTAYVLEATLLAILVSCSGCVSIVSSRQLDLSTDVCADLSIERSMDAGTTHGVLVLRAEVDRVRLDGGERVFINDEAMQWSDGGCYVASLPAAKSYVFVMNTPASGRRETPLGQTPNWSFTGELAAKAGDLQIRPDGVLCIELEPSGRGDTSLESTLTQVRGEVGRVRLVSRGEDRGSFEVDFAKRPRAAGEVTRAFLPGSAELELKRVRAVRGVLHGFHRSEVRLIATQRAPVTILEWSPTVRADAPLQESAKLFEPQRKPVLNERLRAAIAEGRVTEVWGDLTDTFAINWKLPIEIVIGSDDRLTWLICRLTNKLAWNDDWGAVWLDAKGRLIGSMQFSAEVSGFPRAVAPTVIRDHEDRGRWLKYTRRMHGTGISYSEWTLVEFPHRIAQEPWNSPREVFTGLYDGMIGEWFGGSLATILFDEEYAPTGDGQMLLLELEYEPLGESDQGELMLRRKGKVRLTTYGASERSLDKPPQSHEKDVQVLDVLRFDAKHGVFVPAF